jgi:hypothetical protein
MSGHCRRWQLTSALSVEAAQLNAGRNRAKACYIAALNDTTGYASR